MPSEKAYFSIGFHAFNAFMPPPSKGREWKLSNTPILIWDGLFTVVQSHPCVRERGTGREGKGKGVFITKHLYGEYLKHYRRAYILSTLMGFCGGCY